MIGTIVTESDTIIVDHSLISEIYAIFAEYYHGNILKAANNLQRMDYKLYELLAVKLECCSDEDCPRRQLIARCLDALQVEMQKTNYVLFSYDCIRPNEEERLIRNVVRAVNNGWQYDEAKFFIRAKIKLEGWS